MYSCIMLISACSHVLIGCIGTSTLCARKFCKQSSHHMYVMFFFYEYLNSPTHRHFSYVMAYDEELANALGMEDDRSTFAKFYSVLYDLALSGDGDQCNAGNNNVNYDNNNNNNDGDADDENDEGQEDDMDEEEDREDENEDEEDDREEENEEEDDREEENDEEDDRDE